jgi:hypothetical protein
MKRLTTVALLLASVSAPTHVAFAQFPGEAKPALQYDSVGDMQYDFQRWPRSISRQRVQPRPGLLHRSEVPLNHRIEASSRLRSRGPGEGEAQMTPAPRRRSISAGA